jgi:hypothetical protein
MSSSTFNNYETYRSISPHIPNWVFRTFEKPKVYDYIPETFKNKWEDPHKFIPDRMLGHFNQRVFLQHIHRECFNSCVNSSAALSDQEKSCYDNCRNKHLSAIGTFKEVLLQNRKWKGWKNFVNLREFERTPEEIGTIFPTDPYRRASIEDKRESEFSRKQTHGLREVFNSEFEDPVENSNVFDEYMKGRYPEDSLVGQNRNGKKRRDIYNEYKELNEKYGAQVVELIRSKINIKDWKDVPGDDWQPEEETPAAGQSDEPEESTGDS